eukprot:gene25071-10923_t
MPPKRAAKAGAGPVKRKAGADVSEAPVKKVPKVAKGKGGVVGDWNNVAICISGKMKKGRAECQKGNYVSGSIHPDCTPLEQRSLDPKLGSCNILPSRSTHLTSKDTRDFAKQDTLDITLH